MAEEIQKTDKSVSVVRRNKPKASYSDAVKEVMQAIEINASSQVSEKEKKQAALEAIDTVRNSDAMDVLQQIVAPQLTE